MGLPGSGKGISPVLKVRGAGSSASRWLLSGGSQGTGCSQILSRPLDHHKEFGIYPQSSTEFPKAVTGSGV